MPTRPIEPHARPEPSSGDQVLSSGRLSPQAVVCNRILATVNAAPDFPVEYMKVIADEVGLVLEMFAKSQGRENDARKKAVNLERQLAAANEEITLLRHKVFGRSSEAFLEEDSDTTEENVDDDVDPDVKQIKGKRPLAAPRDVETVVNHHFPENRECSTCGIEMKSISRWSSNCIQIIPERVVRIQDVYHTCACNRGACKENAPVAAKAARYIMARKSAELDFVVEAVCQKFMEHQPTNRMESRVRNTNVNLARQTIGRHIITLGDHFEAIANEITAHVMSGPVVHFDETPLSSQKPGIGKLQSGFIWAACRDDRKWDPETKPAVCYHFDLSRGGDVPEQMLAGGSVEVLITDGHSAYKRFGNKDRDRGAMVLARCMAHARRGFVNANQTSGSKLARSALGTIKEIYKIDKETAYRPPDERAAIRRVRILPLMEDLKLRLLDAQPVAQGKLLGAINYFLNAFDELLQFIHDGRIDIDNNPVERRIRPITLSRKSSGGAGRAEYGRTWAVFFTLFETCKMNRIDGRRYLNWAAREIERTRGDIDPVLLLPWNCPVGQITI